MKHVASTGRNIRILGVGPFAVCGVTLVKAPGLHNLIDGLLIMPEQCCPGVALAP